MSGWSRQKRETFEAAFYTFLNHVSINSKDYGSMILGQRLFKAQRMFYTAVFDGLEQDIHEFCVLKSRQLGISTGTRALSTFYIGMHDGMQGTIVFDTSINKQNAINELEVVINDLPPSLGFPKIKRKNRDFLTLANDATIIFQSAGVKQSKGSGTLGRSQGLSFCHGSELCSWDNDEGLEALRHSLSEVNPNRLYIWESTARGFNSWHDMCQDAIADSLHKRFIFLGWWSKDNQVIRKSDPDFERYGLQEPTAREQEKIREVYDLYGHKITPEQLAWIRRKMDPSAESEGDAPPEYEGSTTRIQEQPWVADDAWQFSGATFFPPEDLKRTWDKHVTSKFQTFMFTPGIEFTDMTARKAPNAKSVELKVWEEPEEDSHYVISCDPAFGSNERNDRSAIEVFRCYADGMDQVAEYAWPLINTRQLGWVISALAGWYAGDRSQVNLILELNGPGEAVWQEIMSLKRQLSTTRYMPKADEKGLSRIFYNVRNYIYARADSMTAGSNYHFKTNSRLKVAVMERLRDFTTNGMLYLRSAELIEEMRTITREGDSIEAQGSKKDDRVMACGLAVRCWEERVRKAMIGQRKTRESEIARRRLTIRDKTNMYNDYMLTSFMAGKRMARTREQIAARKATWRYR